MMTKSRPALEQIADFCKVLREPVRLRILNAIGSGELSVGRIVELTGESQPNVSRHLAVLTKAGLIRRRQVRNIVYCSVADERVWKLCRVVVGPDQ